MHRLSHRPGSRVALPALPAMILAAGWLTACGDAPSTSPPAPPEAGETEVASGYDRIEIPLDEALAGDEASLQRNFYFIFDGSGSMSRKPGYGCRGDQSFSNRLQGAQWAVREFMTKVPDDVNVGLFLFDTRGVREVVPLGTGNRDDFLAAISNIVAGRGTPLAQAIHHGTDRLVEQYKRQLGYGEYRLVVITDGQADMIPEAARYASRYGMPIYAIGLCIEEDHPLRRHAVSYRAADSFADLAQGLEETLAELPAFDATEFTFSADAGEPN